MTKNTKIDSASACIHMKRDTPLPLLNDPSPFPQLRTYLMDGLFLNHKTNKNIRVSYSLKYRYSKKKKVIYVKINDIVV